MNYPMHSKEVNAIGIFATAWGNKLGGINALSTKFSRHFSYILKDIDVYCFCKSVDENDKTDAEASDIHLEEVNIDDLDKLKTQISCIKEKNVNFIWWIGHDLITGNIALTCRDIFGGKALNFMHMSYSNYAYVKHNVEAAKEITNKINNQKNIFKSSDKLVAVGPLLHKRLNELTNNSVPSIYIIPGLSYFPIDLNPKERISAISFGRFDENEFFIKQGLLTIISFARASKTGFELGIKQLERADIKIIGATKLVAERMKEISFNETGRQLNLQIFEFINSETELNEYICGSNLSIILSWHEGFGLTAWEAISAGIPLIVSKNTGVYHFLEELGGSALGCIFPIDIKGNSSGEPNEIDIENVSKTILRIASRLDSALSNAKSLRTLLKEKRITWDKCAENIANFMELPILEASIFPYSNDKDIDENRILSEGLELVNAHKLFEIAESNYKTGNYPEAINLLEELHNMKNVIVRTRSLGMDASILKCEIYLRQNNYNWVKALVSRISSLALENDDWNRYLKVKSIENVMLRDQGNYKEAIKLAEKLVELSESTNNIDPQIKKSIYRKLSRSYSLNKDFTQAFNYAQRVLEIEGTDFETLRDGATALAMAEVFRHKLDIQNAIKWYEKSRGLAEAEGNTDCFIWAILGLSDAQFLDDKNPQSTLNSLNTFIDRYESFYRLEKLHTLLGLFSVSVKFNNANSYPYELIAKYSNLGITWPENYIKSVLEGDFKQTKKY